MTYRKEKKIEYNKKYYENRTDEQKKAKRLADREYYYKNKEKVDERNMRYYQENKEKLKEKRVPYFNNRRNVLKEEAKQKLGGKCVWCETTENLEFDHIDPAHKQFTISAFPCSLELWWKEVEKCRLLCKSCHKKHSDAEMAAKHLYWTNLSLEERQKLIQKQLDTLTPF
jgi:hypothetical protein